MQNNHSINITTNLPKLDEKGFIIYKDKTRNIVDIQVLNHPRISNKNQNDNTIISGKKNIKIKKKH